YLALEGERDGGWRDFSKSDVKRVYGDVGYKGDAHLTTRPEPARAADAASAARPRKTGGPLGPSRKPVTAGRFQRVIPTA
ncbi:hypothetical protein ACIKT0_14815, partial [Hansschlegelia beijingensis]|uniref:hypothetical protein n=1 Tax=Hansschlegelia beijingensis TaxID=1133344 RepID=UPI00387F0C0D